MKTRTRTNQQIDFINAKEYRQLMFRGTFQNPVTVHQKINYRFNLQRTGSAVIDCILPQALHK